ncbi:MAG: N-acetylmuramoyl-L-alanine amidase [Salinivirgaceae bacterium]|nr:N-acetylmuramoyl-L-alanine amidase [Salinivirgaceae bacterium]
MNKKIATLLIFFNIATFGNCVSAQQNASAQHLVVLDAGHGGHDTGAIGKNSREKDIVLAITLKVGEYITQNVPNVKVMYTRKTDEFIALDERANIANRNNADLFVSIHANSNKSNKPFGTETFAMGLHKSQGNLDVAQKENSVIVMEDDYNTKYEGFDPSSAESYIIFSLMQNVFLDKSLSLAKQVQDEFRDRARRTDRGVKQAGFLVLWHTKMPSILIETGFISNPEEEKFISSTNGQDLLASAIYRAIKNYFAEIDKDEDLMRQTKPQASETKKEDKKTDKKPANEQPKSEAKPEPKVEPKPQPKTEQTTAPSAQKTQPQAPKTVAEAHNICYRVQVATSNSKLDAKAKQFAGFSNVYEFCEGGKYKYTVGKFATIAEAKKYQQQVRAKYPDAFVVAFDGDKKISVSEAQKLEK